MANELEAIYLLIDGRWFRGRCDGVNHDSMGSRSMEIDVLPDLFERRIGRQTFTRLHGGPGEPVVYLEDRPKRGEVHESD